jgi:hypothetical protein
MPRKWYDQILDSADSGRMALIVSRGESMEFRRPPAKNTTEINIRTTMTINRTRSPPAVQEAAPRRTPRGRRPTP